MNHTRNVIRFAIIVFWLIVAGMGYSLTTIGFNLTTLGWSSWLFMGVVAVVVLYVGVVISNKLWSIK